MKVPVELRILLMLIISSANSVVGQSGQSWRGQNRYENNWPELFLGTELENEDNRTPHRDSIDNRTLHRDSIVSNCNPGDKTGAPGAVYFSCGNICTHQTYACQCGNVTFGFRNTEHRCCLPPGGWLHPRRPR